MRDHVKALRGRSDQLRSLLQPVLLPLSGGATVAFEQASPLQAELREGAWPGPIRPLFTAVQRVERLVSSLFAGGERPPDEMAGQVDASSSRSRQAEKSVRDLLAALALLEAELPRLEQQVAGEFLGAPSSRSER